MLKPLPSLPAGATVMAYQAEKARPLKPELLTVALGLLFADILAVVLLQMGLNWKRGSAPAAPTRAWTVRDRGGLGGDRASPRPWAARRLILFALRRLRLPMRHRRVRRPRHRPAARRLYRAEPRTISLSGSR